MTDGVARFTDQSTQPASAEALSRIAVAIEGLSSTPGRRAKLDVQAVVGGGGALTARNDFDVKRPKVARAKGVSQREKALPGWAAAGAAEHRRRFPGTGPALPLEEQIVALTAVEPLPDETLRELRRRRLQTVLDALTGVEAIPRDRLTVRDTDTAPDPGTGRVDFQLAE